MGMAGKNPAEQAGTKGGIETRFSSTMQEGAIPVWADQSAGAGSEAGAPDAAPILIMGLKAIGREIGKTPEQLYLSRGPRQLPTFSLARRVCMRRATIEMITGRSLAVQHGGTDTVHELRGYRAIANYLGVPWLSAKTMVDRGLIPHTRRGRKAFANPAILTAHFIELERQARRAPGAP